MLKILQAYRLQCNFMVLVFNPDGLIMARKVYLLNIALSCGLGYSIKLNRNMFPVSFRGPHTPQ